MTTRYGWMHRGNMLKYYSEEYGPEVIISGRQARELLLGATWGAHFVVSDDQLDREHTIAVLTSERKLIPVEQWDGQQYHRLAEAYSESGVWTNITFTPLKEYAFEYKSGERNLIHLGSYDSGIPGLIPGDALWLPAAAGRFPWIPVLVVGGFVVLAVVLAKRR